MEQHHSLGTGIEAISHLFLSPVPPHDSGPPAYENRDLILPSGAGHRVLAIISQTPGIPAVYWSAHLAAALSASGKKVLMVDVGTASDRLAVVLGTLVVYPSLDAFLKQPIQAITVEAPGGFRTLSFQLCVDELNRFKPEEREFSWVSWKSKSGKRMSFC